MIDLNKMSKQELIKLIPKQKQCKEGRHNFVKIEEENMIADYECVNCGQKAWKNRAFEIY